MYRVQRIAYSQVGRVNAKPYTLNAIYIYSCTIFAVYAIIRFQNYGARIAQLVEQLTLNQWVQGSSPCAGTKNFDR